MPTPPIDPKKVADVLERYRVHVAAGKNMTEAAREMNMPRQTLSEYLRLHAPKLGLVPNITTLPIRNPRDEVSLPTPPNADEPIEDLLARKKAQFARALEHDEWSKLIPIQVKDAGPVAICAIGDPHLDNDGCDIAAVERDMTVIGRTKGMYAFHVGDITDNWVGRLEREYRNSRTTGRDAMRLAEWMFKLAPPLAVVGGNHDVWNAGMDWLRFVLSQAGRPLVQEHGVRVELQFPAGIGVRIHMRHDFPGKSQYNPTHGMRKEHLFGFRDHINIAGHQHTDAISMVPSPDGYCHWMLRVSGYKRVDSYPKELGLQKVHAAPACALLIDPASRNPAELVKPYWDMEEAADILAFKRRRAA